MDIQQKQEDGKLSDDDQMGRGADPPGHQNENNEAGPEHGVLDETQAPDNKVRRELMVMTITWPTRLMKHRAWRWLMLWLKSEFCTNYISEAFYIFYSPQLFISTTRTKTGATSISVPRSN